MEPRKTHARKEYEQGALDESTVDRNPIRQFAIWYDAAVAAGQTQAPDFLDVLSPQPATTGESSRRQYVA